MFERYTSKLMLTPRITMGALIFDVYPKIQHSLDKVITTNPVQFGSNFNDHSYNLPDTLVYQIGMDDSCQDLVSGQFYKSSGSIIDTLKPSNLFKSAKDTLQRIKDSKSLNTVYSSSRSVNAYRTLKLLKEAGVIFDCTTRLATYPNMTIKSIMAEETFETINGLRATVVLTRPNLVQVEEVKVSAYSHITDSTNKGMQTAKPLESILYQKGGLGPALFTPF